MCSIIGHPHCQKNNEFATDSIQINSLKIQRALLHSSLHRHRTTRSTSSKTVKLKGLILGSSRDRRSATCIDVHKSLCSDQQKMTPSSSQVLSPGWNDTKLARRTFIPLFSLAVSNSIYSLWASWRDDLKLQLHLNPGRRSLLHAVMEELIDVKSAWCFPFDHHCVRDSQH